jgi:DNA polymerase-3 subunit delta
MNASKIIADWKKGNFHPVYWLEGEEEYDIDQITQYAEHHILPESEAGFNLTVLYGRDTDWATVMNACRRYPMFAERQVVVLKEAQQMKEVEKLEAYIQQPLHSTVFIVAYKGKKVDGRSKLAKLLKERGVLVSTKKMYDNQLPDWTKGLVESKGLSIAPKALQLMVEHIGNDLSRIHNEITKLEVNLGGRKQITEDDIEQYVGVSKEFNVFELQSALGKKDLARALTIVQYFGNNPKAAPIQMVLPALYNYFSKVYMIFGAGSTDEKTIATAIGVNPFFVRDYLQAAKIYQQSGTEQALMLLHQYNLRSIGIQDAGTEDASLLKEMMVKMMG